MPFNLVYCFMKFLGSVKMQTFGLECDICDNFLFNFLQEKKILMTSQFTYGPRSYGDTWSELAESE